MGPSLSAPVLFHRLPGCMPFAPAPLPGAPLPLWGGVECTLNRVGNRVFDQIERSGHAHRLDDLDRFADLGLRTLRYPVLWERTAPNGPASADWRWADERLGRMQALGITPIVGFVHHGSGPMHTSLTDPGFAPGLAAFARAFAERYPHVKAYTPVNEPVTTARFAGLYGLWYPHARSQRTFVRALLTQIRAVADAMAAVRGVTPDATLVQTDDLGAVHATPRLAYQADFENARRWLGWDLLSGTVVPGHPLWTYLLRNGATEAALSAFAERPCPPDVIGVNHYVTSERFLDERFAAYPRHTHGGNGRHRYADVEAVRVTDLVGLESLLRDAHARYRRPVAVTESHLGCTREEQMRWLCESYDAATTARAAGADVRAVTAWSLLGAFDWNSLLTRDAGHYEPGVFDVRDGGDRETGTPRPTALAGVVADLAAGRRPSHPALAGPGWWRRPVRLLYPPRTSGDGRSGAPPLVAPARLDPAAPRRPIVLGGHDTPLGRLVVAACVERGLAVVRLQPGEPMADAVRAHDAWATVDASAVTDAAGIELTASAGAAPLRVVPAGPLFGAGTDDDPVANGLREAAATGLWMVPGCAPAPVYAPDLVSVAIDLLIDVETGTWTLAHPGADTHEALALQAVTHAGLDGVAVVAVPSPVRGTSRSARPASVCLLPEALHALMTFLAAQASERHRASESCAAEAAPSARDRSAHLGAETSVGA